MSCYEWEKGDIKIPASEWTALKKVVRDAHNALQVKRLAIAEKVYDALVQEAKGKRGFNFSRRAEEMLGRLCGSDEDGHYAIERSLFDGGKRQRPVKPKKKDFPMANSSTRDFSDDDWAIHFSDDASKTLGWRVFENNHSCERSHQHPVVIAAFNKLDKIQWTSRTGGTIVGNDEYNSESRDVGGGGNYVTFEFSARKQKEDKKRRYSFPSYNRGLSAFPGYSSRY